MSTANIRNVFVRVEGGILVEQDQGHAILMCYLEDQDYTVEVPAATAKVLLSVKLVETTGGHIVFAPRAGTMDTIDQHDLEEAGESVVLCGDGVLSTQRFPITLL